MEMVLFIGSFYWFKDNFVFRKMKTGNIFQRNWFEFSAIKINILQTMKPKQDWWKSKVKVKWWKTFYLLLVTFCWLALYSTRCFTLSARCSLLSACCKSSQWRCYVTKKMFLKNWLVSQKNTCVWSLFSIKFQAWGPEGLRAWGCFLVKFANLQRTATNNVFIVAHNFSLVTGYSLLVTRYLL